MTHPDDLPYAPAGREILGETGGLRVQILTLAPGKCVPWHWHSQVTDTFVCMDGPMIVETRSPSAVHELLPGQRLDVPPKVAHEVRGKDGGGCRFLIVQGLGEHDFHPIPGA